MIKHIWLPPTRADEPYTKHSDAIVCEDLVYAKVENDCHGKDLLIPYPWVAWTCPDKKIHLI